MTQSAVAEWRGSNAVDGDGETIGTIAEIYMDAETGKPEWLAVKTGMVGSKVSFIPIAEASASNGDVRVPYDKQQVKDAPNAEADGELSREEEAGLYSHYGLDYSEARSDSGLPEGNGARQADRDAVGHDTSGPTSDDAMTRSEEQLRVGKASRERGRARPRKYVVTEQVEKTVPLQREEVRLEREPITDANVGDATDGPSISEEDHEVTLHEEEVVTEKRAVPKERVRMEADRERGPDGLRAGPQGADRGRGRHIRPRVVQGARQWWGGPAARPTQLAVNGTPIGRPPPMAPPAPTARRRAARGCRA